MAGDLDERRLEPAGAGQLVIGVGEPDVGLLKLGDQLLAFREQIVLLGGLANDSFELVGVPGLENVPKDMAFVDGVDHRLDVGVAGEEHPDRVGLDLPGLAEEDVAGHPGHPLVGEDQVDLVLVQQIDRGLAGGGGEHSVRAVELVTQAFQHVHFVVDDQEGMPPLHPVRSALGRNGNRPPVLRVFLALAWVRKLPSIIQFQPGFVVANRIERLGRADVVASRGGGRAGDDGVVGPKPMNLRLQRGHPVLESVDLAQQDLTLARGHFEPVVFDGGLSNRKEQLLGLPGLADELEDMPLVDRRDHRLQVGESGEEHPDRRADNAT